MSTRKTTGLKLEFNQVIVKRGARTFALVVTIGQGVFWSLISLYYLSDLYYWGAGLAFLSIAIAALNITVGVLLGQNPNERY